ncbi:hypothetical protein C8A05DRAFT_33687 [Staphylotrichum tortipilum]|uniref:Ubiquitin 3 binding protein But2 C-terminal domain-containing protein n=1 Tax=Staphylotrichum tortipilum TaxID=2831512 RepID=A0AAN6MKJ8_9PEZI|nr:hypothetical protein C8A05DRAFT_33687 [Staphylotrichum longicolle]
MANPTIRRLPLLLPLLHAAAASTNILNALSIHSLARNCQSAGEPCTYAITLSTLPLTLSDTKAAANDDTYTNDNDNTYGEYSSYDNNNSQDNSAADTPADDATWENAASYGMLTCTFTLPTSLLPFSALPCSTTTTTSSSSSSTDAGYGEDTASGVDGVGGEYTVSEEYTVSGEWDGMLQALSLVVADGAGGQGNAEFGFAGVKAVGGVVGGVKMVGDGMNVGVGNGMKGMKKRRGEGKEWKIKGLTRYPDIEKNETDWQFSILDNDTGLEQACLLSSPGSDPSASFYGIPCDANPKYRISWGHNREGDSAVMTVCYTANGTDAWFGFEKVSAAQLLGDSQNEPVYYTGCA